MGNISKIRIQNTDYAIKDSRVDDKVDKVTSTDNAVVRFDGTSGDIQNSGVTINDSNHLTAAKLITSGGTSSQFVKGDGSLDSNNYATESYVQDEIDTLTDGTAASESGNVIGIGEYDLMKIDEVKGKSLVMNQLAVNGDFSNGTTWWGTYNWKNISISVTDGVLRATAKTEGTGYGWGVVQSAYHDWSSHRYFLKFDFRGNVTADMTAEIGQNVYKTMPITENWQTFTTNIPTGNTSTRLLIKPYITNMLVDEWYEIKNVILIDLTQMFGAGNEPTTVEEVEAILGDEYYEYNTGEVVGNNVEKLDVYDNNDTKKGSLALNLTELTGKVNGEGTSVTIFPDGLHGVGIYDSLIVDDDGYARRAIKRMGSVDLGTLTWVHGNDVDNNLYSTTINDRKTGEAVTCICSMYHYVGTVGGVTLVSSKGDKIIAFHTGNTIYIYDSSYGSIPAETFKTAMSGVMLYYELATPIEYVLDTPVQCVTKVYPNGTVKQVPVMPDSTPMIMDVTYLHDTGGVIGGMIGNYATKKSVDDTLPFIVNMSYVEAGNGYDVLSSDKTLDEVIAAYETGKEVIADVDWDGVRIKIPLNECGNGYASYDTTQGFEGELQWITITQQESSVRMYYESLEGALHPDSSPIEDSPNPISSGAVYDLVGNIETLLASI